MTACISPASSFQANTGKFGGDVQCPRWTMYTQLPLEKAWIIYLISFILECLEKLVTTSKDWKAEPKFWSHIVHIIHVHQLAISGQSISRRYMYTMYRLNHYQAYQIHKTIATLNTPLTTPIIPPVQLCLHLQYQLTGWDSPMASVCKIAMHATWGIANTNYHVIREAKLLKNRFNECWSENEEGRLMPWSSTDAAVSHEERCPLCMHKTLSRP